MARKAVLLTNNEMFEAAQAYSRTFATATSRYNYEQFAQFVGALNTEEARQLANDFIKTSMMFYLNKVHGTGAKNPLENQGFGDKYYQDMAGLMQNMYVTVSNPVDPKFVNIENGDGADPFKVRKPDVSELFYTFNADYQNYITLSDIQVKTAFAAETGISQLVSAVMKGLESKFTEWEYKNQLETISKNIDDILSDTTANENQIVEITVAGQDFTNDELVDVINSINNVADAMTIQATGSFNRGKWVDVQDRSDLRVLWRPDFKNALKTRVLQAAFHKEDLNTGLQEVVLPSFGGLIYSSVENSTAAANRLTPKYDDEGRVIDGKFVNAQGTDYEGTVYIVDPYKDIIAIVADKSAVFEVDQNPYSVYGIYNPRNMCTTYWANKPTVGFHFDYQKNFVIIRKAS